MTKKTLNFSLILLAFIFSLIYKTECISGVRNGIEILLNSVIPSLFPFIFLSSLAMKFAPNGLGKLFPLIFGLFCGYPVGAKCVAELYENGDVTKKEAENMLLSVNNGGISLFVVLFGHGLLNSEASGLMFFLFQSVFAILIFVIFNKKDKKTNCEKKEMPLISALILSAKDAVNSVVNISSYIIIFSFSEKLVFSLFGIKNKFAIFVLSLFFEITGGLNCGMGLPSKSVVPISLFFLGFGGLSVLLQSVGIIRSCGLSAKKLILGRLVMAFLLCFVGIISVNIL